MAYMSQERKAQIAPKVKSILKKYHLKGSLSVSGRSTLVLTIKSGVIDFISNFNKTCDADPYIQAMGRSFVAKDYIDVNVYHFEKHFSGQARKAIEELYKAMMVGNHNNSRIEVDYFDVGWHVRICIGKWNKPYTLEPLIKG